MDANTFKKPPISSHTSAMLRVMFRPEAVEKYRQQGVAIEEDGCIVFGGGFRSFRDSKPCFEISAHPTATAFSKFATADIPLDWNPADILFVGYAFEKGKFLWKAEWGEQEMIKEHGHSFG